MKKRQRRNRLKSNRGDVNLVTLAMTLPLFLLVSTAAIDVIRLPLVKQQVQAGLHAGFDSLIYDEGDASGWPELASGRDWCAFVDGSHDMDSCPACADEETCTGAPDTAGAQVALDNAIAEIYAELTSGSAGYLSHENADISIEGAIYNLVITKDGANDGVIKTRENVVAGNAIGLGASLGYDPDLDAIVNAKFVTPGDVNLGINLTGYTLSAPLQNNKADIPVVVLFAAVRVHHIFPLPDALRFGIGTEATADTSTIGTTFIRPLARGVRLSGVAAANPLLGGSSSSSTSSGCCGGCFMAGTMITMADGSYKPIENVEVGDSVLSGDEDENIVAREVTELFVHPHIEGHLIVETADGRTLHVTANHRVYSDGKYVPIGELTIDSPLHLLDGDELKRTSITSMRKVPGEVTVYNFEVDDTHTYIAEGYLVHNLKPPTMDEPCPSCL